MILLIALLVLAVASIVASAAALRTDGYGRWVTPPRSHSWEQDTRVSR